MILIRMLSQHLAVCIHVLCHEVLSFWRKIKTAADRNNEQRSFKSCKIDFQDNVEYCIQSHFQKNLKKM